MISYIDTMYAYYLPNVNTSALTDLRWAEMFKQLMDIRQAENGAKK